MIEQRQVNTSRRRFLRTSVAFTAGAAMPLPFVTAGGLAPPSERLNIAVIGVGGRGQRLTKGLLRYDDVRIAAIADPTDKEDYARFYYRGTSGRLPVKNLIDKHYVGKGLKDFTPKDYVDFRRMLDKEKSLDAVVVATPDHVHAHGTLAAIRLGKHVYCEKPLTHSIEEARKVTEEARRAKVATQMGNQGNSGEGIRQMCEWIWDGAIGGIREVHAWSGAKGWAGEYRDRPKETPAVPKEMNWDLWLGPVKHRPYHPAYAPYNWRGWWRFGTGAVGDMGCHNIDPALAALRLEYPSIVEASTTGIYPETVPLGSIINFTFPRRGDHAPVKLTWYDGGLQPPRPRELKPGQNLPGEGILFIGKKGKILAGGWSGAPRLLPEALDKDYERPPRTLRRVAAHDRAWLDACKGGPPASSRFDYSGPLTELMLLGNVAQRTGERLLWDGENMRATNSKNADQYVRQEYRKDWTL